MDRWKAVLLLLNWQLWQLPWNWKWPAFKKKFQFHFCCKWLFHWMLKDGTFLYQCKWNWLKRKFNILRIFGQYTWRGDNRKIIHLLGMSYFVLFLVLPPIPPFGAFSELVLLVYICYLYRVFTFIFNLWFATESIYIYIRQHATRRSKKVVRLPRDISLLRDWWGWGGEGKVFPSTTPAKLLKTRFTRGDVVSSFRPPILF